jgi:hypothetical protein
MTKRLVIVARERKNFLETASAMFAGEPGVAVILDRRLGTRRMHDGGLQIRDKRDAADRRRRPQVDVQVQRVGFAAVRLD